MKKAIVFDLDDTLYLRSEPYLRAVREVFGTAGEGREDDLIRASRRCSYEQYEKRCRGEIDYETMIRRRTVNTFAVFHRELSEEEAQAFEAVYAEQLETITLRPVMAAVLSENLAAGGINGLITNGPSVRQREKITRLGLERFIPPEYMLISSELGLEKPEPAIFRLFEERSGLSAGSCLMVGDHAGNDIAGALAVGWHAAYLVRPPEVRQPVKGPQPDLVTASEEALQRFLERSWYPTEA